MKGNEQVGKGGGKIGKGEFTGLIGKGGWMSILESYQSISIDI